MTSNKPVKIARTKPRMTTQKDYSDLAVEGRKGRPDNRTRRQARQNKRTFE